MEHYRIKKPMTKSDGNTILVNQGVVALTDDAHGADRYVELKRQGYTLERLPSSQAESR